MDMLPKDLTRDVKNRLNTIKGQVEGIVKMLDEGKDPQQILNQFKAVTKALETAQTLLVDETFRKSLASKISEVILACPGNCGQEQTIESLRVQFPTLAEEELTQKMREIQSAYELMNKFKKDLETSPGTNRPLM